MRDATIPGPPGRLVIFAGLFCLLPAALAQNPVLRDVEVRSFLGEPLNLRIALAASTVRDSGAICQSVIDDDRRENALRAADLVLTMVELRDSRYLRIRSRAAFDDPIARFSLRIGCPGEPIVVREFTALLDPPPFTSMPGSPAVSTATAIGASPSILSAPPTAVKSARTPAPAPARAKPVVPPASAPASAIKPAPGPMAAPRGESFQLRLSGSEMDLSRSRNVTDEQRRQLREKLLMLDADDQMAALLSLRNTVTKLEQRLNEMQLKLAATPSMRPTAPSPPASVPPAPPSTPPSTPEASTPAAPSAPVPAQKLPSTPDPAAAAPAAAKTPEIAPAKAPAIVAAAPQASPAPAPPAPEIRSAPVTPPLETPAPREPSLADTLADTLSSPLVAGGIGAGLLALLAAWAWLRRDRQSSRHLDSVLPGGQRAEATPADATPAETARPKRTRSPSRDSGLSDRASQQVDNGPSTEPPASEVFMRTSRNPANERDAAARGDTNVARANAELARADAAAAPAPDQIVADAHSAVDAPVIFDDTPARFEVDSRPATTVDFLVGMDEKLPEDRVRRLQYMHERYPELKSNTVSIDDADSVINAARLYYEDYEEADKGTNRDKASELLTFAVEERPQEIRFWLAQFEICRLENMVPEFTAMAGKFHVLFSHTTAWPKVRQIGHELDPGNPLFAAGGGPLLADETRFDPIAENWLNAPMDFTSDALMSDLRLALLDDNGVSRADFESITARLSATAGAVSP